MMIQKSESVLHQRRLKEDDLLDIYLVWFKSADLSKCEMYWLLTLKVPYYAPFWIFLSWTPEQQPSIINYQKNP